QILFLCTLSQFLLAPLLWSFWIIAFGIAHPMEEVLPAGMVARLMLFFLATELLGILVNLEGLRRIGYRISPLWVPSLHFYFPLAALASYKALWELVLRPFYWDKTSHGIFDPK